MWFAEVELLEDAPVAGPVEAEDPGAWIPRTCDGSGPHSLFVGAGLEEGALRLLCGSPARPARRACVRRDRARRCVLLRLAGAGSSGPTRWPGRPSCGVS